MKQWKQPIGVQQQQEESRDDGRAVLMGAETCLGMRGCGGAQFAFLGTGSVLCWEDEESYDGDQQQKGVNT